MKQTDSQLLSFLERIDQILNKSFVVDDKGFETTDEYLLEKVNKIP